MLHTGLALLTPYGEWGPQSIVAIEKIADRFALQQQISIGQARRQVLDELSFILAKSMSLIQEHVC